MPSALATSRDGDSSQRSSDVAATDIVRAETVGDLPAPELRSAKRRKLSDIVVAHAIEPHVPDRPSSDVAATETVILPSTPACNPSDGSVGTVASQVFQPQVSDNSTSAASQRTSSTLLQTALSTASSSTSPVERLAVRADIVGELPAHMRIQAKRGDHNII